VIRLIALIAAIACATPLKAQVEDTPQVRKESAFGHRSSAADKPDRQPVIIDIEIEKDGEFFWRGRIDGRSDEVALTSGFSENPGCIILASSPRGLSSSHSFPSGGPKLEINIRSYRADEINPIRFDLSFKYERPVLTGDPCGGDVDLRTTEMRAEFLIASGETRVLPPYSGFQVTLVRQ
jgi:hypothetical protein